MSLGWLLRDVGLLTEELVSGLNRLAFVVVLPILLFQKIGSRPLGEVFNGALITGTFISFGAIWLLTFALLKIKGNVSPRRAGVIVQGAFRPNTAVVGLAILSGAWGGAVFGPGGMLLGALVPFINVLAVLALLSAQRSKGGMKGFVRTVVALVSNPLIIGALLGAVRSATGVNPPGFVNEALDMLSDMAIPVALLGAGGSLRLDKLRADMRASFGVTFIKLIVMPALTWAVLRGIFRLSGMILAIGVIFAATPTSMVSFIMADQMEGDSDLAVSIVAMTDLFSIITISLWLAALFRWG